MKLTMTYVPMRDGTGLFTRVFEPDVISEDCPVLYVRSPYDDPKTYADEPELKNFTYVFQSCRGTAASEGDFVPFRDDRSDGLDTLDWIRKQPFYRGSVYPTGGSYVSAVHLWYLSACPPDVKGAILRIMTCDAYSLHYENGQYKYGLEYLWNVGNLRARHPDCAGVDHEEEAVRTLPSIGFRERILRGAAYPNLDGTREAFLHPTESDPYWKTCPGVSDAVKTPESISFPLFLSSGHYDIFIHTIPDLWKGLRPEIRQKSLFVITPYCHAWTGEGQIPFENDRRDFLLNIDPVWVEYCRTGKWDASCGFELGKCNYYVLFGGRWIAEEFLTDGTETVSLRLGPGSLGDGADGEASYVYDPANPTTFRGTCGNVFGNMEAQDGIGTKKDVLYFLSKPFEKTVTLKGVQSLRLRVRSDCEDTAFYARLSLVRSDGTTYAFRDRITSLVYALGAYEANSPAELTLDFDPVAIKVKAGERLRLDVASADWPSFMPHTNTAGLWCEAAEQKIAVNTVEFSGSELTLRCDD